MSGLLGDGSGVQLGNYATTLNNIRNFSLNNNVPTAINNLSQANPVAKIASWGNNAANATQNVANQWNQLTNLGFTSGQIQQLLDNQTQQIQNQGYNQTFSNWLNLGQLGAGLLSGLGSYFNGKSYLNLAKNQLAQQQNQFNETYNNALKKENAADSALISNRALYKTGDSHAYDDEIAANAYSRGHTGTDSSEDSYLGYKRSANA